MSKLKKRNFVADYIRKGLVIFQFASSIILIIGVLVILQQLNYIRTKNLGYNPKGVLAISLKAAKENQVSFFADDLKNLPKTKKDILLKPVARMVQS
jgi:putative ABC transport system permease protein